MRIIDNNVKLSFGEPEFVITTPKKTGKKTVTCILRWTPVWPTLHNLTLDVVAKGGELVIPTQLSICDLLPENLQKYEGKSIGIGAPIGDDIPDVEVGMKVSRCKAESNAYKEFAALLNSALNSVILNAAEVKDSFHAKRKKFDEANKKYMAQF